MRIFKYCDFILVTIKGTCFRLSGYASFSQTFTFMVMLVPSDGLKSHFSFSVLFFKVRWIESSRGSMSSQTDQP